MPVRVVWLPVPYANFSKRDFLSSHFRMNLLHTLMTMEDNGKGVRNSLRNRPFCVYLASVWPRMAWRLKTQAKRLLCRLCKKIRVE